MYESILKKNYISNLILNLKLIGILFDIIFKINLDIIEFYFQKDMAEEK